MNDRRPDRGGTDPTNERRRGPGRTPPATVVALAVAGWLAFGCGGGAEPDLPVLWPAPEFALVDQDGDSLRAADLRGDVWVASFVFTNCTGVCPLITARMAGLRDSLAADGLLGEEVRLVSFSVDPARDTPEVLRDYAARFDAGPPPEWVFLTGHPPERVRAMIQEGFKLSAVAMPAGPADTLAGYQVDHSPRLVLVDREGRVRGTYPATEPTAVDSLRADVRRLVRPGDG